MCELFHTNNGHWHLCLNSVDMKDKSGSSPGARDQSSSGTEQVLGFTNHSLTTAANNSGSSSSSSVTTGSSTTAASNSHPSKTKSYSSSLGNILSVLKSGATNFTYLSGGNSDVSPGSLSSSSSQGEDQTNHATTLAFFSGSKVEGILNSFTHMTLGQSQPVSSQGSSDLPQVSIVNEIVEGDGIENHCRQVGIMGNNNRETKSSGEVSKVGFSLPQPVSVQTIPIAGGSSSRRESFCGAGKASKKPLKLKNHSTGTAEIYDSLSNKLSCQVKC